MSVDCRADRAVGNRLVRRAWYGSAPRSARSLTLFVRRRSGPLFPIESTRRSQRMRIHPARSSFWWIGSDRRSCTSPSVPATRTASRPPGSRKTARKCRSNRLPDGPERHRDHPDRRDYVHVPTERTGSAAPARSRLRPPRRAGCTRAPPVVPLVHGRRVHDLGCRFGRLFQRGARAGPTVPRDGSEWHGACQSPVRQRG